MTFIGMISDHKSFDKVKEELKEPQLELININKKITENLWKHTAVCKTEQI